MERIQSAIDKARKLRGGGLNQRAGHAPVTGTGRGASPLVTENWLKIPEVEFNPRILHRNRILAHEGGPEAGPFDMMRTKVLQQMRANNWRRLAITSPSSGCGKTTTCTNLAFSLSRQKDLRTVTIETDLRRPAMAGILGQRTPPQQFSKVLAGGAQYYEHMVRYRDNLCFGIHAMPVNNSAELLQSAATQEALDQLEKELDPTIVLFDTAPLMVSDDTIGFLEQVDCVLLVAEAEVTSIDEIDICEKDLAAHTNVLGVVLNKCRYMGKGYGYGYEYGY